MNKLTYLALFWAGLIGFFLGESPTAMGQYEKLREGHEIIAKGEWLKGVELLRHAANEHPDLRGAVSQSLPLISDYAPEFSWDQTTASPPRHPEFMARISQSSDSLQRLEAMETIRTLARDRQIVILNEAHDCPQHRAFGQLLATQLRNDGFEFLAVETLAGKPRIVTFPYPVFQTGYYSAEPVFADFLRQANRVGFQFVAYEIQPEQSLAAPDDQFGSIIEREDAQSDNLILAILKDRPQARILMYVGYSHATEDWQTLQDGRQLGWLAAQLRRKTGIDPLTIDQVGGSYNPKRQEVDPVFSHLHRQQPFRQPTVCRWDKPSGNDTETPSESADEPSAGQGSSAWLTSDAYFGKVDLTVFHPPQTLVDGRPDWLSMGGYRKPKTIANGSFYRKELTLLQAFLASEPDGLPVDQLLISTKDGSSTFLLPPGDYVLRVQTASSPAEDAGPLHVE